MASEPLLGCLQLNPTLMTMFNQLMNPLIIDNQFSFKSSAQTDCRNSLPRAGSLHVVGVDVNIRDEFVQDAPGRVHDPVGHLRRNSHREPDAGRSKITLNTSDETPED